MTRDATAWHVQTLEFEDNACIDSSHPFDHFENNSGVTCGGFHLLRLLNKKVLKSANDFQ